MALVTKCPWQAGITGILLYSTLLWLEGHWTGAIVWGAQTNALPAYNEGVTPTVTIFSQ